MCRRMNVLEDESVGGRICWRMKVLEEECVERMKMLEEECVGG